MRIERPDTDAAEALADLWVELARGQRDHGSHVLPAANRTAIREALVRHVVTDGLLVARKDGAQNEGEAVKGSGDGGGGGGGAGAGAGAGAEAGTGNRAILGFVMFSPESNTYEQDVTRGVIHNLYVREAHRGGGVGTALVEAAETALEERGFEAVTLEVMAGNADARQFYRDRGFAPHRVEMEKALSGRESDTP